MVGWAVRVGSCLVFCVLGAGLHLYLLLGFVDGCLAVYL